MTLPIILIEVLVSFVLICRTVHFGYKYMIKNKPTELFIA